MIGARLPDDRQPEQFRSWLPVRHLVGTNAADEHPLGRGVIVDGHHLDRLALVRVEGFRDATRDADLVAILEAQQHFGILIVHVMLANLFGWSLWRGTVHAGSGGQVTTDARAECSRHVPLRSKSSIVSTAISSSSSVV